MLFAHYGWDREYVESLTYRQLELWTFLAIQDREQIAGLHAAKTAERAADLLVAAGILKRR